MANPTAHPATDPTAHRAPPPTYQRRSRRLSAQQVDALATAWPRFGIEPADAPLDLAALFGRTAPVVLEIGFGSGETTVAMATAQPDTDILAVEVHRPGVATLLHELRAAELTNVRVALGDARELLAERLAPASLSGITVFFPDPWPKSRHRKRRLVTAPFVRLAAERLRPGGWLHVATDWAPYAEQVRRAVAEEPLLTTMPDGSSRRPSWRPVTRFERRGLDQGRAVHDLVAHRTAAPERIAPP